MDDGKQTEEQPEPKQTHKFMPGEEVKLTGVLSVARGAKVLDVAVDAETGEKTYIVAYGLTAPMKEEQLEKGE